MNLRLEGFFSSADGGGLAEPALEERGFPPDILMEEMIPTLKLVIRAVRWGAVNISRWCSVKEEVLLWCHWYFNSER